MLVRNRIDRPSDPGDSPVRDAFRDIAVETGAGRRSSAGVGDRLVLVVAVIALIGGLLIVGGKVIGDRLIAKASASPSPVASARSTANVAPSAPAIAFTLQPGPLPVVTEPGPSFSGWVRALRDQPVYAQPDRNSVRTGVLKRGALAFAYEYANPLAPVRGPDRWLQIQADAESYVLASSGGAKYLDLLGNGSYTPTGYIGQLVAGSDRFVAVTWQPTATGESGTQSIAVSTDGDSWAPAKIGTMRGDISGLAYGPAGWVAATQVAGLLSATTWIWRSEDAISWTPIGQVPEPFVGFRSVIASPAGYLLLGDSGPSGRGRPAAVLWSMDAARWEQIALPDWVTSNMNIELIGAPWGFYLKATDYSLATASWMGAGSMDGRTWTRDATPPSGSWLQVAPTESGLVGVSTSPIGGEPRAWAATLQEGQLRWQPDAAGTAALRGTAIPSLLSDGRTVLALGAIRDSQAPAAFHRSPSDGSWTRDTLHADPFGGTFLYSGAALPGPHGTTFIAIGSRPTLASDNPTLWRRTSDGAGEMSHDQLLPFLPDPPPTACPPRPRTALDFALLDTASAVNCFGGQPITFRAWATLCLDCGGAEPGYTPAWLADPNASNALGLSPITADGVASPVVAAEGLRPDARWDHHWVQVTGHFDDPAAATCRVDPNPQSGPGIEGRALTVIACRKRFVVTRVTLVSGP